MDHFKRRILVTGGAGFIGSCIAEKLLQDKSNFVLIVDNLITGDRKKLPDAPFDNMKFIHCDVNSYKEFAGVMISYKFDYVFHYAALVGVKRTLENPLKVLDDITGIRNILELSKNTGVKRVFYSSSSEVYGEPVELPQNEDTTPLNSRLPYAIIKNVGGAFLRAYQKEYGLDFTIFRFFNTYGPKQSKDFVMSRFILAALTNKDIEIYGDGLQTRTFCYVDDNVDACLNTLYHGKMINQIVNIGSNIETTILDLARLIIKIIGSKSKIVYLPALSDGDMRRRLPDITKMRTILDRELIPLEKGISNILKEGLFELNN